MIKQALAILSLAHILAMPVFEPTDEWQPIPEGMAVPGGLEIRMDLDQGGRWARKLPKDGDSAASGNEIVAVAPTEGVLAKNEAATTDTALGPDELERLEDLAHDSDEGDKVAQQYGPALLSLMRDSSNPRSDQAGRILSICLRNNNEAARHLIASCPDIASGLSIDRRSLALLSSLVSTKEGFSLVQTTGAARDVQAQLARRSETLDHKAVQSLTKLLRDLAIAGEDGQAMCDWVDAIQQAFYVTKNPDLRQLAIDIIQRKGDFENLTVNCKPQPGLLPAEEERKRAETTAQRVPNSLASRNHFDEL